MQYRRLIIPLLLVSFTFALLLITSAFADHSDDNVPDTACTAGQQQILKLELGDGIPLPTLYGNPSDSTVTFFGHMNSNLFFGPAHELGDLRTVPPGMGTTSSEARVIPTSTGTPVGSDRVLITIYLEDGTVVATCDYWVTLERPSGMADLIQIPIRWCVVEGSQQANGLPAGSLVSPTVLHQVTREANDQIWVPQAHIALTPALMATSQPDGGASVGVPIIPDPDTHHPPSFQHEQEPGEVDVGLGGVVGGGMARECDAAWRAFDPDIEGIVVVNIRKFDKYTDENDAGGVVQPPKRELLVSQGGARGDDLCGHPRDLTVDDIASPLWGVVIDPRSYEEYSYLRDGNPVHTLAHEFGHMLMLGHGNGLDDNRDGSPAGAEFPASIPGSSPRRFDQHCDPLGTEEDALTQFVDCETDQSLMRESGCTSNTTLQPLQLEIAHATAPLVPGAVVGASCEPGLGGIAVACGNDEHKE